MSKDTQLDSLDLKIIELLQRDARMPYLEIARSCNVAGATIHLRIQKLEKMGIMKGSRLFLNYKKLGLGLCSYLGISIDKFDNYEQIIQKIQQIPEVIECHFMTGEYTIFLKVYCKDTTHLRHLLMDKIQSIEHIVRTETFISLRNEFEREPEIINLRAIQYDDD